MTHPDKEHTLALLREWKAHQSGIEKLMAGIESAIGIDVNGTMYERIWGLFASYTHAISSEVGDFGEWMDWYHYENDMGKKGGQAGYDENLKPIKTLTHLYGLIAESRKRETK